MGIGGTSGVSPGGKGLLGLRPTPKAGTQH